MPSLSRCQVQVDKCHHWLVLCSLSFTCQVSLPNSNTFTKMFCRKGFWQLSAKRQISVLNLCAKWFCLGNQGKSAESQSKFKTFVHNLTCPFSTTAEHRKPFQDLHDFLSKLTAHESNFDVWQKANQLLPGKPINISLYQWDMCSIGQFAVEANC